MTVRKFILAAVPRSGSTFLINVLAQSDDVQLPEVNQHELLNGYEKLFNCHALRLDSASESGIIDGFFAQTTRTFAGFKTIPGFHREWTELVARDDIQFITLIRRDFLSCLASYIVSDRIFRWNLASRDQIHNQPLVFRELYPTDESLTTFLGATLEYLLFNYRAIEQLNRCQKTIAFATEDLATSSFSSAPLESFFGRPIQLDDFRTPTHYTECFRDHFFFEVTVVRLLRVFLQFDKCIPASIQKLIE